MDLVKTLLDHDANIDQEDGLGRRTPLYIAAKNKNSEMASLLISHGASTLNTAFGKTIQEVIEEQMPYFDCTKIEVIKQGKFMLIISENGSFCFVPLPYITIALEMSMQI